MLWTSLNLFWKKVMQSLKNLKLYWKMWCNKLNALHHALNKFELSPAQTKVCLPITTQHSKTFKNVQKCAKTCQNAPKHPATFQNVPEHVIKKSCNTLKNSPGRPKLSKILQHKENRSWKSSTVQKCREFCRTNKIDPTFLHRPKMSGILQYK